MKTLILTHCYPPNGGTFIKHRAKLIDASVLTMGRPLGFWNFVRFVNDAVGSARKYEIIEAHWLYPAGIAAMIASWITKTPYRVYCHGTDVMMAERSWFWRFWAKRVLKRARKVFAVSRFLKDKIQPLTDYHLLRWNGEGWYQQTIGIDPMEVDKSIFYDRGLPRLSVKAIVKKNVGKYDAVLAPYIPIGRNLSQEQLADIFSHSTIIILASENEGYGLMLAEAAECGCKIIGVNEGGIPEVVAKYGGLLFDGTAEDLKEKISIALNRKAAAA